MNPFKIFLAMLAAILVAAGILFIVKSGMDDAKEKASFDRQLTRLERELGIHPSPSASPSSPKDKPAVAGK